jgi:hypothetical protein
VRRKSEAEWACTWGTGAYFTGERHIAAFPAQWNRSGTRRLVIECRGGSNSTVSSNQPFFVHWATAGLVALCCDLGSPNGASGLYGNDTVLARIASAWTWAKANLPVKTDKFVLSGGSRGSADAINYLVRNASQVIACVLGIPPVNLEDVRANNRSSQQAVIEAAYTNNAGWQAARPTRNPWEMGASVAATGVPLHVWSSTDDPISLPTYTTDFVAATGATHHSMGAVGHSVPASVWPEMDAYASQYA